MGVMNFIVNSPYVNDESAKAALPSLRALFDEEAVRRCARAERVTIFASC